MGSSPRKALQFCCLPAAYLLTVPMLVAVCKSIVFTQSNQKEQTLSAGRIQKKKELPEPKSSRGSHCCAAVQFGVFWTNGQICSSTSRLLVQEGIAPAFYKQLKKRAESIKQCDPLTQDCRM